MNKQPTACQDPEIDPEIFFDIWRRKEALAVCDTCWFVKQCRELSADEEYGVWGGELHEDVKHNLPEEDQARRDAQIIERRQAGQSAQDIADLFSLGVSTVREIVRLALGSQPRQRSQVVIERERIRAEREAAAAARDAAIIELRQKGTTYERIAAEVNTSLATVYRACKAADLQGQGALRKPREATVRRDAQIIELRSAGVTDKDICRALDIEPERIEAALQRTAA